jgi:hypothetical protein
VLSKIENVVRVGNADVVNQERLHVWEGKIGGWGSDGAGECIIEKLESTTPFSSELGFGVPDGYVGRVEGQSGGGELAVTFE